MGLRIERYFWNETKNFLAIENKAQQLNERINLYSQILTSEPQCLLFDQKDNLSIKNSIFLKTQNKLF